MKRKNPITQAIAVIFGAAILVCCGIPSNTTVTRSNYMSAPTPTPALSHNIASNDSAWHEVWRKAIGSSYSKGVSRSFPLVACHDGVILVPIWGEHEIRLVALNARDGNAIWSQPISVPKQIASADTPTNQENREPPSRVDSIAVDSEQVYIALPNAIESLSLRNGQEKWVSQDELTSHTGYYIYPLDENKLLQVYGVSATQAWVYEIDKRDGKIQSIKDYTTDILQDTSDGKYLSTPRGLIRVDKDTDQVLWSVPMPGPVRRWLTFVKPGVMLASSGTLLGSLFGIDLQSGSVLWKTSENIASSYAVIDNSVYSLDEDARLIARNVVTGKETGQIVFDGTPLDVTHASEYWVVGGECGLLIYFGDSHELVVLSPN